jgi:tyrosine-protein kinase
MGMSTEVKHYAAVLGRWAWLLAASTLIAATISYVASSRMPRTYSATTTLMVGQALQAANPQAGDFQTSERLAQTYAQLVRRQPVLEAAIQALQLNVPWQALAGQISATALPNTQLVQITVLDSDPRRAVAIADEVTHQLIRQSPTPQEKEGQQRRQFLDDQLQSVQSRITGAEAQIKSLEDRLALQTSARDILDVQNQITALQQQIASWQASYTSLLRNQDSTNNLSIVDPAVSSGVPISPNVPLNVAAAAAVGLLLGLLAVVVIEFVDDTIKNKDDVERILKLPFLGGVPRLSRGDVLGAQDIHSLVSESYRVLRTQLCFASPSGPATLLLVTSAAPGEGKTTTACNLAVSLAQAGRRVIVCDTDFRRPSVHKAFGVANDAGLSTLLNDRSLPIDWALLNGPLPNLKILPSGPMPLSPADLLGSPRMRERVLELEQAADVVILDSPALLAVVDAAIVASLVGGALLVVDAGRTRADVVRRIQPILERAGVSVLGVVLNRARDALPRAYYAYYSRSSRSSASATSATVAKPHVARGSAPRGGLGDVARKLLRP